MPPPPRVPGEPRRHVFRRRHRLTHAREYQACFDARCRKNIGPLALHGRPNGLPHSRLGLAVGRRVGRAVRRNRVKRCLREAFRFIKEDWSPGYDIVVVVRPHPPALLADYQRWLHKGIRQIDREWQRRHRKSGRPDPKDGG